MAVCRSCGAEVPTGATTCPSCNATVTAKSPSELIGALSYLLGFVTGLIFLNVEPYDKDEYVRFHAKQSIAFSVAWFAFQIVVGVLMAIMPGAIRGLLG